MVYKKCLYCFEKIQEEAILCKHCKSSLVEKDYNLTHDVSKTEMEKETLASNKNKNRNDKRTLELVLGLLEGIGGLFSEIFALFFGGIDAAITGLGTSFIGSLGVAAILFSILGIVGSILVKQNGKWADSL